MIPIKNILYLGWLGKGNVGDDVLFELFKTMFYKHHQSGNKSYAVNIDPYPLLNNYKIDLAYYDLIVLGAGSLFNLPFWAKICEEGIKNGVPVVSWGTGYDDMYKDGQYDFSRLKHTDYYRAIYEKFAYISVRGPLTKNMLTHLGVKNNICEIGDPALAYASETFDESPKHSKNSNTILINWGTSYNNIFGRNELAVEQELVKVIRKLITQGFNIIIYPIWTEDIEPVKRLGYKVNDEKCEIKTVVNDARTLFKMINESFLSINLKLHANILFAAANLPFISLAYRGKCFEFSQTVNCLDYTIATDSVTSKKVLKLVKEIKSNYSDVVDRIESAKSLYYPRLKESIDDISRILS